MTTQRDKVIAVLEDGEWHSSNEFRKMYMADPPKIISDLKKYEDYDIEVKHDHGNPKDSNTAVVAWYKLNCLQEEVEPDHDSEAKYNN